MSVFSSDNLSRGCVGSLLWSTYSGRLYCSHLCTRYTFLVWWNRPAPQTSTGEVLHGGHADMHQRTQVKEHVVEGVDRQASSFICVFQRYDGRVQGVGQVTEPRPARFNHFLGALQRVRGWTKKICSQAYRINHRCRQADEAQMRLSQRLFVNLLWRCHRAFVPVSQRCQQKKEDRRSWSNAPYQDQLRDTPSASHPESSLPQILCAPGPARSVTIWGGRHTTKGGRKTRTEQQSMVRWGKSSMGKWVTLVLKSLIDCECDRILINNISNTPMPRLDVVCLN